MVAKEKAFFCCTLLLLALSGVSYAWTPSDSCFAELGNGTLHSNSSSSFAIFDDFDDGIINQTIWKNVTVGGGTITESAGFITINSSDRINTYFRSIPNISLDPNSTIDFKIQYTASPENGNGIWELRNFSETQDTFGSMPTATELLWALADDSVDGDLDLFKRVNTAVTATTSQFTYGTSELNITLQRDSGGILYAYMGNGSMIATYSGYGSINSTLYFRFSSNGNQNKKLGRVRAYNGMICPAAALDTIPPKVNVSINNTAPKYGQWINLTFNLSDNVALLSGNITLNMSGIVLLNYSFKNGGFWEISNITNITCFRGCTINITGYATDTNNNVGQNSTLLVVGNTPPIAKNVSMTNIEIGNNGKGHCNFTDIDSDLTGGNETYWWNGTKLISEANNSFTLLSGNFTIGMNVTFSCRVNDTRDWSNWINSSTISVGDLTSPAISTSIVPTTIISGSTANFSINASDNGFLSYVNMTIRSPTGLLFNRSCIGLNTNFYICNVTFFDGDETSENGVWNLTEASAIDTSGNSVTAYPNITLTVNAAGGGGGGSSGGGGGGGDKIENIKEKKDCKVFVTPEQFEFTSDNPVQLLEVKNIESSISYSPTINLPSGFLDIRGQLNQIIIAGKSSEITLIYNNFVQNLTNINLLLQSEACKDIFIPITLFPEGQKSSSLITFEEYINKKIGVVNILNKEFIFRLYHLVGIYSLFMFTVLLFVTNIKFLVKVPIFIFTTISLTLFSKLILDILIK